MFQGQYITLDYKYNSDSNFFLHLVLNTVTGNRFHSTLKSDAICKGKSRPKL